MLDKVTWQLDIYNAVGDRSGMHNTCENKQLWKGHYQRNHKRDVQVTTHFERGGDQVKKLGKIKPGSQCVA